MFKQYLLSKIDNIISKDLKPNNDIVITGERENQEKVLHGKEKDKLYSQNPIIQKDFPGVFGIPEQKPEGARPVEKPIKTKRDISDNAEPYFEKQLEVKIEEHPKLYQFLKWAEIKDKQQEFVNHLIAYPQKAYQKYPVIWNYLKGKGFFQKAEENNKLKIKIGEKKDEEKFADKYAKNLLNKIQKPEKIIKREPFYRFEILDNNKWKGLYGVNYDYRVLSSPELDFIKDFLGKKGDFSENIEGTTFFFTQEGYDERKDKWPIFKKIYEATGHKQFRIMKFTPREEDKIIYKDNEQIVIRIKKDKSQKIYFQPEKGEKPPKGVITDVGPRQGIFYDPNSKIKTIIQNISSYFSKNNFELYEVGGRVRDSLLNKKSEDIDLTTNATPDETEKILKNLNIGSVYDVGKRFGTVGLITKDGEKIEITTFRGEVYESSSRKPEVKFGELSLKDDLSRRDFTINSLARNPKTNEIIDYFGGQEDLKNKIIRAVGNSKERFFEDPLRMLRAARFAAQLGFSVETEMPEPERLNSISKERIAMELNKILLSQNPVIGFRVMDKFGLLEYVIPEINKLKQVEQKPFHLNNVFDHVIEVVDNASKHEMEKQDKLVLMLAALFHDIEKASTRREEGGKTHFYEHEVKGAELSKKILSNLRYDSVTIKRVSDVVKNHMLIPNNFISGENIANKAVKRLIQKVGKDNIFVLMNLAESDIKSSVKPDISFIRNLREKVNEALKENPKPIVSPLDGNELMARFNLKSGRILGNIKDFLTDKVIEGELKADDKEAAYEFAQQFLSGFKKELITDIDEYFFKARKYFDPMKGETPPEGTEETVKQGARGGWSYEEQPRETEEKTEEDVFDQDLIEQIKKSEQVDWDKLSLKQKKELVLKVKEKLVENKHKKTIELAKPKNWEKLGSFYKVRFVKTLDRNSLLNFVDDTNKMVRQLVAQRIDSRFISNMKNDIDPETRVEIVKRMGQKDLISIINDKDSTVRVAAVRRMRTQSTLMKLIFNSKVDENLRIEAVTNLSSGNLYRVEKYKSKLPKLVGERIDFRINNRNKISEKVLKYFSEKGELPQSLPKSFVKEIRHYDGYGYNISNMIAELYSDTKFSQFHLLSIHAWQGSSNSNIGGLLKKSVGRNFDGDIVYHEGLKIDELEQHKNLTRRLLDIAYPKKEEVLLYRGIMTPFKFQIGEGEKIKIKQNPISSWTLRKGIADRFGDVVIAAKFSKDKIWSSFLSHSLHTNEQEFLTINSEDQEGTVIKGEKLLYKEQNLLPTLNIDFSIESSDWIKKIRGETEDKKQNLLSKIDETLEKTRIYIQPEKGEKPPERTKLEEGERGGLYYETDLEEKKLDPGRYITRKFVDKYLGNLLENDPNDFFGQSLKIMREEKPEKWEFWMSIMSPYVKLAHFPQTITEEELDSVLSLIYNNLDNINKWTEYIYGKSFVEQKNDKDIFYRQKERNKIVNKYKKMTILFKQEIEKLDNRKDKAIFFDKFMQTTHENEGTLIPGLLSGEGVDTGKYIALSEITNALLNEIFGEGVFIRKMADEINKSAFAPMSPKVKNNETQEPIKKAYISPDVDNPPPLGKKQKPIISKGKIYFQTEKGEEPPEGTPVEIGPRGGTFFEGREEDKVFLEVLEQEEFKKNRIKELKSKILSMGFSAVSFSDEFFDFDRNKRLEEKKETLNTFIELHGNLQKVFEGTNLISKDLSIKFKDRINVLLNVMASYDTLKENPEIKEIFIGKYGKYLKETYFHEMGHYLDDTDKIKKDIKEKILKEVNDYYREIRFADEVNTLIENNEDIAYSLQDKFEYLVNPGEIIARFFDAYVWAKLGQDSPFKELLLKEIEKDTNDKAKMISGLTVKALLSKEQVLNIASRIDFSIEKMLVLNPQRTSGTKNVILRNNILKSINEVLGKIQSIKENNGKLKEEGLDEFATVVSNEKNNPVYGFGSSGRP